MHQLLDDVGLIGRPRIQLGNIFAGVIRADKQVLTSLLFNATNNALAHGETGAPVLVSATLDGNLYPSTINPARTTPSLSPQSRRCTSRSPRAA